MRLIWRKGCGSTSKPKAIRLKLLVMAKQPPRRSWPGKKNSISLCSILCFPEKTASVSFRSCRLQGLLRRSEWMSGGHASQSQNDGHEVGDFQQFSFSGKTIDFGALELRSRGNTIHLTLMESELLRHLVRHDGKIVSRKDLLEQVWGLHEDTDTRAIDNFVVRLRRYIEDDPGNPQHLLTVRGVGYRFFAEPRKENRV